MPASSGTAACAIAGTRTRTATGRHRRMLIWTSRATYGRHSLVDARSLLRRYRCFLNIWRDIEVTNVELMDLLHLPVAERRVLRRGNELLQLHLVVDVRQRADDRGMRVEPQQRQLADGDVARDGHRRRISCRSCTDPRACPTNA